MLIEYEAASRRVKAVYDDIRATRKTEYINNFWKALANDPATLERTWESVKTVMAPGALDPLTKELIYVAVSATNGCGYCIASHTASARAKGMTPEMFGELMALFSQTVDELFEGTNAELAKQRAFSISTVMQIKIINPASSL